VAQSTAGTNLVTNYAAPWRVAARSVLVCWDGTNWTDETARVQSVSIRHELLNSALGLPMLGQGLASQATLTLSNHDGRYCASLNGSIAHTYYPNGIYRVPIRIAMGYSGETLRQFTGEIVAAPGSETTGRRTVQFQCQDYSYPLKQIKHVSQVTTSQRVDEAMDTLLDAADSADAAFAAATTWALDKGLAVIPYIWTDDENLWTELGLLAASEAGLIHFSKEAQFRFWRQTAFLERTYSTTSQVTLARARCFALDDDLSWLNAYTKVIVEASPWRRSALAEVYQAQAEIVVEPGQTVTHRARFTHPVMSVLTPVEGTDYRAVTAGMSDLSDNLVLGITAYAQQATITLQNTSSTQAIYVLGLTVRGYPLEGRADDKQEYAATLVPAQVPGQKDYTVPANAYVQTRLQAELVGTRLRDLLQRPRRLIGWSGPLCPWLELGDRVTLVDAAHGFNEDCIVLNLVITASVQDMSMDLTLLPVANLFPYSGYFVWGTSAYSNNGSHRSYY